MTYANLQTEAQAALGAVVASMPAEGKTLTAYLAALHKHSVVALGEDEAFALADKSGEIKAFKQRLILSVENGGLVKPGFSDKIPYVVSAQGYEMWAEAAGACVIFPESVMVDGVKQTNPHVIRDPNNRRILNIYARAVAFRFSSKGLPMVADWTTAYDVPSYRLIDLVAKAKQTPQAFKLLPADMEKPKEEGTWGAYPFDETMVLWVNSKHGEALKWYGEILNREKKALDFAQTFARRNACKHLSGLQKAPGPQWHLSIICWRPTGGSLMKWDSTTYANVQRRIEGLGEGQDFAALPEGEKPMAVQYTKGVDRMDEEEGLINAEDEEKEPELPPAEASAPIDMAPGENGTYDHQPAEPGPATMPPAADPEPAQASPDEPQLSEADQKDLANYEATREACPDEDAKARRRMSIKPNAAVTPAQARELYKIIGSMVDGEAS
ncbi:MAG: hypothetical protein AB7D37_11210 [Desulfovibrio sp.]